tara:strand:+ start:7852 stop:8412 length:561 start_codon:yes stop_codon:yes gene_type:complete
MKRLQVKTKYMMRKYKFKYLTFLLPLAIIFLSSCGYRLEGTKIPKFLIGKNYIFVSQFKNMSGESNLSQIFTRNVRNSFLKDGRLKPADKNKSDVSLKAKIIEYKLIPVGFSKDDQVQRYRVFLKIEYELSDLSSGNRLQFKKLETEIEFEISSKVDESDKNRNDAVEKGAENFSLELLDTIFETF